MATNQTELDRYIQLTPKSREVWEDAKSYLPGGDSRNSIFWDPYPVFVERASGAHVIDIDGGDRLDFIGTMTTLILGHAAQPVVEAVREQLERGESSTTLPTGSRCVWQKSSVSGYPASSWSVSPIPGPRPL